jgi:hypothetical protein
MSIIKILDYIQFLGNINIFFEMVAKFSSAPDCYDSFLGSNPDIQLS